MCPSGNFYEHRSDFSCLSSLSYYFLPRRVVIPVLYRIGTLSDCTRLSASLPEAVHACVARNVAILDREYGENRHLDHDDGGYCLFAETAYDVRLMYAAVDFDCHPCEWADRLDAFYCSAMFLLSNDFAIVCIMPISLAPAMITEEILSDPNC